MGINKKPKIIFICVLLAGLLIGTAVAVPLSSVGDRIWDENANQSLSYTWTPQSYSGFYYDLDTGEGSENMTIQLTKGSRTIGEKNIQYVTAPIETDFERRGWGSYQVIGFMAERYFAGYTKNSSFAEKELSLISNGQLTKVLTDTDEKKSLYTGSSLVLSEGYSLNIMEVDIKGDKVWVQLEKDGKVIDEAFLSSKEAYVYKTKLGTEEDVPLIAVYFSEIFRGIEANAVFVEGIFQLSDSYIEIKSGDDFGKMEVSSISSSSIKMRNPDSVTLGKGDTVKLMGKLNLVVADSDALRFAPTVDTSEPGTYELRGTVYDEKSKILTWTPFNFEGFYYNIDDNVSTEQLVIDQELNDKTRTIEEKKLVYTAKPEAVKFEHKAWGRYEVIGFLAEKYFAGYPENTLGNSKSISVLSNNILAKVLVDDDDKKSLYSGSSLMLENGYSLKAAQVDVKGEKVLLELYKDGKLLDSEPVTQNNDYVYETDLGGAEKVPVVVAHISTVFQGREVNAVFVEGVFQISDDYLKLETGNSFDKMEISSISDTGIVMKNADSITLSRDKAVDVMDNVGFKVADSEVLRFYPFVKIESKEGQLEINMSDTLALGSSAKIQVTSRGVGIGGVEVFLEENRIGNTSEEGFLSYTPDKEGNFTVYAKKEGYVSASKKVEFLSGGAKKLSIGVSPEKVFEDTPISIKVSDALSGKPVAGAEVFFGNQKLADKTASDGTVSYKVTAPGTYGINATLTGYETGEINVEVKEIKSAFVFSDLKIEPPSIEAGKAVKITANVTNTGSIAAEVPVELLVNGTVTASTNVSLNPKESKALEFTHTEKNPGNYTVAIGDQTASYEVVKKAPFIGGALSLAVLITAVLLRRRERK